MLTEGRPRSRSVNIRLAHGIQLWVQACCKRHPMPNVLVASGNRVPVPFLLATLLLLTIVSPGWAERQRAKVPLVPNISRLRSTIYERLEEAGGLWSISVGFPDDSEPLITLNAHRPVPAASLYKLVLLVEVLRQNRSGEIDLDEPLVMTPEALSLLESLPSTLALGETMSTSEALETMITSSSNTAAVLVGERVGWWRSQATVAALGLRTTSMAKQPTTTAADMQLLLRIIAGRPANPNLLHSDDANRMVRLLAEQLINDRVPMELQRRGHIAHKTGDLVRVRHDAGLLAGPAGPVTVVLMATEVTDGRMAKAAMRDVYRAIYQELWPSPNLASTSSMTIPRAAKPSASAQSGRLTSDIYEQLEATGQQGLILREVKSIQSELFKDRDGAHPTVVPLTSAQAPTAVVQPLSTPIALTERSFHRQSRSMLELARMAGVDDAVQPVPTPSNQAVKNVSVKTKLLRPKPTSTRARPAEEGSQLPHQQPVTKITAVSVGQRQDFVIGNGTKVLDSDKGMSGRNRSAVGVRELPNGVSTTGRCGRSVTAVCGRFVAGAQLNGDRFWVAEMRALRRLAEINRAPATYGLIGPILG